MINVRSSIVQRFMMAGLLTALSFSLIPALIQAQDERPDKAGGRPVEQNPKANKNYPVADPTPPPVEAILPIPTSKQPVPEADAASGALTYLIKVAMPPGRSGMQPDLGLVYNSLNTELGSPAGYGWELLLQSIERRNVNGVDKLYSSNNFTSSLDGELRVQISSTFFARVDSGSAFRYEFSGSGNGQFWKVTDKEGKQYFFGESPASKLSDPNDGTKIFRWMLTRMLEPNGNSVNFVYQKFSNQVYLQEIDYTNNQSATGIFKVVPEYEDRPDIAQTGNQGFLVSCPKRLTKIKAYFANQITNETQLSYIQSPLNKQSLLSSVRNIGYDALGQSASLGNWTFTYDSKGATALMTGIELPTGENLSISYIPSAQVIDPATNHLGNSKFPYSFYLVQTIQYIESGNVTRQEGFQYTGGAFYFSNPLDKRVAGFEKVVQADGAGNTTTTYYHQGNGNNAAFGEVGDQYEKLGRPYKIEVRSALGQLFTRSLNVWNYHSTGNNGGRTQLTTTVTQQFDGNTSHRDKAVSYVYDDQTGNVTQETHWGEVSANDDGTFTDIGSDKFVVGTSYASNLSVNIIGLPSQKTITDHNGLKVAETRFYYDGQALGQIIKGNQTSEERWKGGSTYVPVSRKEYDSVYGLMTREIDGRGNATSYIYDQFNLYPATITNALSQSTQLVYDYSSGKVTQSTDPNIRTRIVVYDGLGRVTEEKQPDPDSGSVVTKTQYVYTDQPNATSVKKVDYLDASTAVDSYVYLDGLGRTIQTRKRSEGTDQFAVSDTIYNSLGLVASESLAYFSNGSARTTATSTGSLYGNYSYDTLDRVLSVNNSVGTTTSSYDDWKTTVTDALGKSKTLYSDAFGRVVRLDESSGGTTYSTGYDYDAGGNFVRITDAQGNMRNFSYDGLGRRTTAEDLHAPLDATFGIWQFTFDDANNLSQRTDPKGQTVAFAYDALNRVTSEDLVGQGGIENSYVYDCPISDGIGRLCQDSTSTVSRSREYNALGLVKKEITTMGGLPYITQSEFDFQGNMRKLTNPDGSQVEYDFNQAGSLEAVSTKEQGQLSFTAVVTNFNYSPTGEPSEIVYSGGTRTVNTYDPNQLYRPIHRNTAIGNGATVIQDLDYTFDAVGNIKQIRDNSNPVSPKTLTYLYDDLDRLTSAEAIQGNRARSSLLYKQSYSYNALGNIISRSDQGNYLYNGNQGSSYANPHAATMIGNHVQSYDQNGNLVSDGNQISFTWDYNNRLRQTNAGGNTITYDYTSDGERLSYAVNASAQIFTPTRFFSKSTTDGIEKHIYAGNTMLATIRGTGAQATIFYDHTDHLSGANVVTLPSGKVAERLEYYPFGGIFSDTGRFSERRKFAGHEYDSETGLSDMGARYYDSARGRFLSQDPMFLSASTNLSDPQAFNSYAYARNNPLRYVDPTGKSWKDFALDTGKVVLGSTAWALSSITFSAVTIAKGYGEDLNFYSAGVVPNSLPSWLGKVQNEQAEAIISSMELATNSSATQHDARMMAQQLSNIGDISLLLLDWAKPNGAPKDGTKGGLTTLGKVLDFDKDLKDLNGAIDTLHKSNQLNEYVNPGNQGQSQTVGQPPPGRSKPSSLENFLPTTATSLFKVSPPASQVSTPYHHR